MDRELEGISTDEDQNIVQEDLDDLADLNHTNRMECKLLKCSVYM